MAAIGLPGAIQAQTSVAPGGPRAASPSVFTVRPQDAQAVYLDAPEFQAKGDGIADDTQAIQDAINKVKTGIQRGIVFVPEGRYRITRTVYVWAGIRLIGYGANRPTFVLPDNTPGFQGDSTPGGGGPAYMLRFVNEPPRPRLTPATAPATGAAPASAPATGRGGFYNGPLGPPQLGAGPLPVPDGNPGSFFSAMNNINIEIGKGNPAAVGCRFFVAQHCYLANIDFHIGEGRAGVEAVGNEGQNLNFFGGEYGLISYSTAPSWPYLLIDSKFEGQRQACLKTDYAGMTLVRCSFKNAPVAVTITEGKWESLFMKDCTLENIRSAGVMIGNDEKQTTRVNLEDIACAGVPTFAAFHPDTLGKPIPGTPGAGGRYIVKQFSYGIRIPEIGGKPEPKTTVDSNPAPEPGVGIVSDIPALPPSKEWVDVTTLGLKGDNATDNTAALRAAIEKHRVLYFPIGRYRVTDTITLKPDTVLIGFHPMATQLVLPDGTANFSGEGANKALLETPQGGANIVTGIGLDAGNNVRAIACKWMAGKNSYMNDVKFIGGHGTFTPEGNRVPTYNGDRRAGIPTTGDADPNKKWDAIPYSLWITNGGGGTFKDIWSANPQAKAGVAITDTTTEGRLYAVSIEHHCTVELKLSNASNWRVYAQQQEEERTEGVKAIALDVEKCSNITFGNLWFFRMAQTVGPFASRFKDCKNIEVKGVRCYSPNGQTTFQNSFYDANADKYVETKDIGWLTIGG